MQVLIIEDEPLVAKDIHNILMKLEPDCKIVGPLSSVDESRRWFVTNPHPDLILADIQLSDGISFEIFENTRIASPIIFTTAYDDYAIRAFKLNSIDYLLKPIDKDELEKALRKYKTITNKNFGEEQLRALITQWGQSHNHYKERFLVLHGNALVPLVQRDIAFFHKDQIIFVHTMLNEKFICEFHALDDIESLLDPSLFFRVNRQYIIHIQSVSRVKTTHKGLSLQLKNHPNMEIEISREKAAAFKNWLG